MGRYYQLCIMAAALRVSKALSGIDKCFLITEKFCPKSVLASNYNHSQGENNGISCCQAIKNFNLINCSRYN